ncbi:MAG: UDP-glucose/GDP-mannose dehydrogenase family protein [Candidatus Altiarchaeota archaeon]|nr:UDP-glucose/GDP-mannose dehydrogenase family protein [Candidatus Altiarchaeota archaeon]
MNISVVGSGYVGLITAAGFAEKGHNVVCVDVVSSKVDSINRGKPLIYEEGLDEILRAVVGRNLSASMDLHAAVLASDITFICVGTPSRPNGSIELKYIKESARQVGLALGEKKGFHIVVVKSTVIPGTTDNVIKPILEKASGRKAGVGFGLAMNPEFLREGFAVEDFRKPDRIIVGASDSKSMGVLERLYAGFPTGLLATDLKTAEMIKYASNAFLATKISFINEVGNVCKSIGVDTYKVAEGMGLDKRITPHFLRAGIGFGGSCFPKDVKSLVYRAKELGIKPRILKAVLDVNHTQPRRFIELARKKAGSLKGRRVAVLGLAFKGGTDDIRESPAVAIVHELLKEKANVVAYDPKAAGNARDVFGDRIVYAASSADCLRGADIALIVTEWEEFRKLDFSGMKRRIVVDGKRMLDIANLAKDVDYEGICW